MSGGFLERWSRRKGEDGQSEPVPDKASSALPAPDAAPEAPPPITDEELAALPRIEDLTPESSLAPFLRVGVPSGIRNAAMRKMWLLTPAIRDHKDCAVDYHWDWNTPGGVPGSGGPLEPGAVQKMLKGLAEPRPHPAQKSEAAQKPDTEADMRPQDSAGATGQVPGSAPAEKNEAPTVASQPATDPAEPQERAARMRHGGARPS